MDLGVQKIYFFSLSQLYRTHAEKKCRNEKHIAFIIAKKKKKRFLIVHGPGGKKGKIYIDKIIYIYI